MCFPHVINICVDHVTDKFTNKTLADDSAEFNADFPPGDPDQQTFTEACNRNPIALCRSTVVGIRASGKRRDHLAEIIHDGNAKGWFRNLERLAEVIQVKSQELIRDVKTRWDALYKMIRRFREMRQVRFELLVSCILLTIG